MYKTLTYIENDPNEFQSKGQNKKNGNKNAKIRKSILNSSLIRYNFKKINKITKLSNHLDKLITSMSTINNGSKLLIKKNKCSNKITIPTNKFLRPQINSCNQFQPQKNINRPADYVGPISGWKKRAIETLEKKLFQEEASEFQNSYQPQLNPKSLEICNQDYSRFHERVEDRLIKYGNEVKSKKNMLKQQEQYQNMIQQEQNMVKPRDHLISNQSHNRLFEYHEFYKQKKIEKEIELNSFPFKPQINKVNSQMEATVEEIRKANPLFPKEKPKEVQIEKPRIQLQKYQLEDFLLRNYEFPKLKKSIEKSNEREVEELEDYTFQPELNQHSRKLLKDKSQNYLERNKEFLENKENKIKQYKYQNQDLELKECSFQPKLNQNRNHSGKTSQLNQFQNINQYRDTSGQQKSPINHKSKLQISQFLIHEMEKIPAATQYNLESILRQDFKSKESSIQQNDQGTPNQINEVVKELDNLISTLSINK